MAKAKLTAEDKKWRARDDVRTLADAKAISKDKPRFAAAKKEAKSQAKALSDIQYLGS